MPHFSSASGSLLEGHDPRRLAALALEPEHPHPLHDGPSQTQPGGIDLLEEIGRGGMGVVYRARQRGLDRIVAVKVLLRAHFASLEERERFHREAQAAARLRHPGIVAILDVGEDDGVPWFSMEHIAGQSLEQLVRKHPLNALEAARCARCIAEALQHAHENGVLHRDLKPSNIMLDKDNRPHITDFGIARIGSGTAAAQLTRTGQMLGSPGYAAPEQALTGDADLRTDVYGLGALLYHLLTGRPPFQGPTLDAILVQLREDEPLPPRRLNPGIPVDIETICLKCLQKAPEARYTSAGAVADDLGRFLDGGTILARPVSLPGRLWRWTRRHRGTAAMITTIALLFAGLIGGSLAFARHMAQAEHRASLISEARSLRQTRLAGSRTEALARLREAAAIHPSKEVENEVIACFALPEIGRATRLQSVADAVPPDPTRSSDGLRDAVFVRDEVVIRDAKSGVEVRRLQGFQPGSLMKLDDHGSRIAIAEPGSGRLKLVNISDGRLIALCEHPLFLHSLDWSGNLIATGCDNRFIYVWQDDGTLKHRLSGHEGVPIHVAFRPRSQELASTSQDAHVRLWHAARGEEVLRLAHEHRPHRRLWWGGDGRRFLALCDDDSVESFPFTPGGTFDLLAPPEEEPHSENLGSAVFSSDGRLAAVIDEVTCRLWDFETGRMIPAARKAPGQWLSALFARDNSRLWLSGWDLPLTSHALRPGPEAVLLGEAVETKIRHGSLLRGASADNKHLVLSNNGTGEFIVFTPDSQHLTRVRHPGTLACAIANDGSWLATSSYQGRDLRLWSLPDGRLRRTLITEDTVMQLLLTPDGAHLLCNTGRALRRFNTATWEEHPMPAQSTQLRGLALSPDGRLLASLGDDHVRLLDALTLKERQRLILPGHAGWLGDAHLVFSQAGGHLLVHTALGSVGRWDLTKISLVLADF
jgi:WD40 repeat protein/predicted Ser/Thr protein kinase